MSMARLVPMVPGRRIPNFGRACDEWRTSQR